MKYLRLLTIATLVAQVSCAQRLYMGVFGGASAYNGDLTSNIFPKKVTHGAIGLSANYDLSSRVTLRSGITYSVLGGTDLYSDDESRKTRNLSFETSLFEWSTVAEVNLLDMENSFFSPYVFTGVALFKFNPYAYDQKGEKVFLQPLSTEGQGLSAYPDRKPYHLTQIAIPFGGGIKVDVNDNIQLGFEVGLRKLFTEYLDDVSTEYVNWEELYNAKGQLAVDMSYRGDELNQGIGNSILPYPGEGTQRGDPSGKDTYYFTGLHVSYKISSSDRGSSSYGRQSGRRSKTGCPVNVY